MHSHVHLEALGCTSELRLPYRRPQAVQLYSRGFFPQFWRLAVGEPGQPGWFGGGPSPPADGCLLSLRPHVAERTPVSEDTSQWGEGPPLLTIPLNLSHLLRGLIYKYSLLGVRASAYVLWGHTMSKGITGDTQQILSQELAVGLW